MIRTIPAALLAFSALACAPRGLDRGLQAIRSDHIAADVGFIACDDLQGRDTPSPGQRLTARFIVNRLQRLGFRPGAPGGWFHVYPLEKRALDESNCRATVKHEKTTLELAFGADYSFLPRQIADHDLAAPILHLGKVPESLDPRHPVKGKWILFTEPGGALEKVESELLAAGAVGVLSTIHVMSNLGGDPEGGVVFKLFGDLMRDGYVTPPDTGRFIPRVYLKPATIDRLLSLSETGKPVEFSETRRMKSGRNVECENVVALWPGRDPERARKAVIVSAHYDHVGVDRRGRIHNGADDNGSGTAGLLALAEALVAHGPLEYSVLLAWLSGEEKGLWGSEALVRNPDFASGVRPAANINLDMIGRNDGRQLLLTPFDESHPKHSRLAALARASAAEEGFTDLQSGDPYFERSDQASFAKLAIPVVFLTDGMHADYHQPTDDAEKIDAGKIERVARVVFRMLDALQPGNDVLTR